MTYPFFETKRDSCQQVFFGSRQDKTSIPGTAVIPCSLAENYEYVVKCLAKPVASQLAGDGMLGDGAGRPPAEPIAIEDDQKSLVHCQIRKSKAFDAAAFHGTSPCGFEAGWRGHPKR